MNPRKKVAATQQIANAKTPASAKKSSEGLLRCSAPKSKNSPDEPCMQVVVAIVNPKLPSKMQCLCATHFGYFCDYYENDEDNRPPVKYVRFRPPGAE